MSQEQHLLQDAWTWYIDVNFQNMKQVYTFSTVETFWQLFNNIPKSSDLKHRANYRMFKNHIQPMQEDPANSAGGAWIISVPDKQEMDTVFKEILMAVIGNVLSDDNCVNGVIFNSRYACNRMAVWVNQTDVLKQAQIGQKLRQLTGKAKADIVFKKHQTEMFEAPVHLSA